jgi:hypothetical protein
MISPQLGDDLEMHHEIPTAMACPDGSDYASRCRLNTLVLSVDAYRISLDKAIIGSCTNNGLTHRPVDLRCWSYRPNDGLMGKPVRLTSANHRQKTNKGSDRPCRRVSIEDTGDIRQFRPGGDYPVKVLHIGRDLCLGMKIVIYTRLPPRTETTPESRQDQSW